MLAEVKKRLESLGYIPTLDDDWPLGFVVQKVENQIKADCNVSKLPTALHETAVDMAAGEFLLEKKAAPGGLEGFDLEVAEKSIQEGDTRVDFAVETGKSPEQRLDALISWLLAPKADFAAFRRIKW